LVRWLRRQHLLSLIRLPLGQRRSMARSDYLLRIDRRNNFFIGSCYSCRRTSMKSIVKEITLDLFVWKDAILKHFH
jgi:hypothetical protein